MMCDRCDQPIPPGKGETRPIHGDSGAGGTVILHRDPCPGPPPARRSYPVGRGA